MMKKLVLAALVLAVSLTASGVPAIPKMKSFIQSDGSTITVGMRGDEWFSSVVTTDGYTVGVGANGDYYYKTLAGLTPMRAHDVARRDAAERAFLSENGEMLTMKYQAASLQRSGRVLAPPRRVGTTQVPTHGSPRIPILLVQYTDKQMSNPKSTFIAQYTSGERSAYQYFADQSWNQYQPQFDVYGIYNLPSNRATYGAHGTLKGVEFKDVGLGQMVIDAITQAGDEIDWSLYDNDNNGDVDVCIVVYAGVGEAQAYGRIPDAVWPCQWNLSSAAYYGDGDGPVNRNEKSINRFAVFNEVTGSNDRGTQIDGVGTFCHEFSHCLGLPDFYETTYVNDYYGMGSWSIMCSGCYNNDGYTPCGYTAYEKNFMGWMNLTNAVPNTQYTLDHIADEGAQAVKITSKSNANEYYILENRQQEGWNAYIASSGLMVTHVTYNASAWSSNTVNNTAVQRMTIIPADNSLQTYDEYGDLYPCNDNNQLTDESTPAATLHSGGMMGQPVTKIMKEGSKVSFYFIEGEPNLFGDVNLDGFVDVADVNILINIILQRDEAENYGRRAYITNDDVVDVSDVNALINIILAQ